MKGPCPRANIVIVVSDSAVSKEFKRFLQNLELDERLGSIFLDEAHVYVDDIHWRFKLEEIKLLALSVVMIFLTATFPPSMERRFEEVLLLRNPKPTYICAIVTRPQIAYSMEVVSRGCDLADTAINFVLSEQIKLKGNEKILIFASSIDMIKAIQKILGCAIYHVKLPAKEAQLERWRKGEISVMIASTALGEWMDIEEIMPVIHVGKPYRCNSFTQGSGRARRKGEQVRSVTFIKENDFHAMKSMNRNVVSDDEVALNDYMTMDGCR